MARNRTVQRKARQLKRRTGGGFNAARDQVIALPPLRARLTHEEWLAAGRARFGTDDISQWSALCPRCGHVTSVARFAEVSGTTELTQAFTECLGRHLPGTGSHTFPCDWAAWGHIPLYGYIVVVDGREFRVFAFPAPDEDVAKNKARQEGRAAAWQVRIDAAAKAEAEAEEDQEEDGDQTDVCESCDRPVGRRHRQDCIWRVEELLGEWMDVEEVHTWADGQALLDVATDLEPAIGAYIERVGQLLTARGIPVTEQAAVRVEDGFDLSADGDVTLRERNQLGGLQWFSWDAEHGWSFTSMDPAQRPSPVFYAGGPITPVASEAADRIAAVVERRESWTGQRIRQRAVVEPGAWHGVAGELKAAVEGCARAAGQGAELVN
ncbi:VVA0879 family protein [Streptomyces parvulus]|uniref:VVA0879 family protein n=1 Tax=Streptomyces parvulus TaxID=146923 RepID=UPI00379D3364